MRNRRCGRVACLSGRRYGGGGTVDRWIVVGDSRLVGAASACPVALCHGQLYDAEPGERSPGAGPDIANSRWPLRVMLLLSYCILLY